jgi:dipeptidyl aminopeptidase/acylaminoacyl peptidase
MRKKFSVISSILILLVLIACNLPGGAAETEEPESLPPLQDKETEVLPEETSTPAVPTATSEPTLPSTPDSLNLEGPYLMFSGESGIWISNPDGSFLTKISEIEMGLKDLRNAVSPDGKTLALVVDTEEEIELRLVSIPEGNSRTIAILSDRGGIEAELSAEESQSAAALSILYYEAVAWSPGDGRYLAFVGATSGNSSDLYVYDTQTEEIKQLTSGPSQAIIPIWSPDGRYIYHFGVSWVPPFGGALGGYTRMDGAYAVRLSDGEIIDQPKPKNSHFAFVAWQDATHYIMNDADDTCNSINLRSVDIETAKATPLMKYSFYFGAAFSPENGAMIFSGDSACTTSLGDGLYLLGKGNSEPIKLSDKTAYEVSWLPESKVFWAYPEGLYSADGSKRYDPPVYDSSYNPAVSVEGFEAWVVIEDRVSRVEVKEPGKDWVTVSSGFHVDALIWNPVDGKQLIIAGEDGTLFGAAYPDFELKTLGEMNGYVSQAIWLT